MTDPKKLRRTIQIVSIQEDGRAFVDMPAGGESPCSSCGACCSHFRVSFYFGELDGHPGGVVPAGMASKLGHSRACMSGTESGGRCVALNGPVGRGPVSCSIYPNRPSVCREFPVWLPGGEPNPDCQRLRAGIGLPPLPRQGEAP